MVRGLAIAAVVLCVLASEGGAETDLRLRHGIAATLHLPEGEGPFPAVLMLHGLGSSRSEIGNFYVDAAEALGEAGIASLRFDFRGFGESIGDTGAFTLDRQQEDALIALEALAGNEAVDPARIGVLGFSFGAGAAMELAAAQPEAVGSVVVWSAIGNYVEDMKASLGQRAFDRAAEDGIVGLDLGWRTMALKEGFFDSLFKRDLLAIVAGYPGPLMMINGADDVYGKYVEPMMDAAGGVEKVAVTIEGADHSFHVYIPSRSKAAEVIEATVARFGETL